MTACAVFSFPPPRSWRLFFNGRLTSDATKAAAGLGSARASVAQAGIRAATSVSSGAEASRQAILRGTQNPTSS